MKSSRLETMILKELIHNEDYARKVLPFIKSEYFINRAEKTLYQEIESFILKYNNTPTYEALIISINDKNNIKEEEIKSITEILEDINGSGLEKTDNNWLLDNTEKFCQEKAIYNAVLESITILDNKGGTKTKGAIPQILSDALAVSFDPNVGHDYIEDSDKRFDFYHKTEKKIPFDLDFFNKITRGGIPLKTLNIILAGTGVGKTLAMCHFAASFLSQGYNVLYITMEMAEEKIAERIDANLLNVDIKDLENLPKDIYDKKVERIKTSTRGKLIIKEYPTASASVIHFRNLLNELNLKRNFKPDIIVIDYLNICASARVKPSGNINSYMYIKMIAEELRGLAVEQNVPLISATQTTRSGYENSDPDLTDTSESFGLPATADFMFALISTEQLEGLNQIMIKQLKNRYNDPTVNKRFVVGIDRAKMKLYDVEDSAQTDLADSGQTPVMDKTPFRKKNFDFNKFKGLKT
jgi:replicative DNA helicase